MGMLIYRDALVVQQVEHHNYTSDTLITRRYEFGVLVVSLRYYLSLPRTGSLLDDKHQDQYYLQLLGMITTRNNR